MRVISYNLLKDTASGELVALADGFDIDILCLQECDASKLPERLGSLRLAESTKRNRLGLALYFREDRFTALDTTALALKRSLHDMVFEPTSERLIGARLIDNETQREIVMASFHAAPLTALNSLRRHQIHAAYAELRRLGEGLPTLMVGDFNYPLFKKGLRAHVGEAGYDLTLSDRMTYTRYKIFRGHFDFVTSSGFGVSTVQTLPRGKSDHMPILATIDYSE
jgi:endonuclease/exonuclease/phosphatase family metal-dependent hydrolase